MTRRVALVLLFALLTAGSASGHGSNERKQQIDEQIARLRDRVARANHREGVLTSQISAVTARIRTLEGEVGGATARLTTLEAELAVYEERLAKLTELYTLQTRKLQLLTRQHEIAQRRLEERLVEIYESDDATTLDVALSASSFTDLLDQLEYLNHIGRQDRQIATQVETARRNVHRARVETGRTRTRVQRASEAIRVRVAQQRAERDRLLASRQQLAAARQDKQQTLASVEAHEDELLHEIEGLERASRALAARIQAAQSSSPAVSSSAAAPAGAVSSAGMVWPVSGPVTSGFGWRWGRMHEGVDIAAPTGTPIVAAASGTVIYSGWMDGYGNLVVVDHGGGLATAYAHMSSIGAGNGQGVGQGQVIGYVGCTGHCFGSHLHFEVRVNGSAVDPLGYL